MKQKDILKSFNEKINFKNLVIKKIESFIEQLFREYNFLDEEFFQISFDKKDVFIDETHENGLNIRGYIDFLIFENKIRLNFEAKKKSKKNIIKTFFFGYKEVISVSSSSDIIKRYNHKNIKTKFFNESKNFNDFINQNYALIYDNSKFYCELSTMKKIINNIILTELVLIKIQSLESDE